MNYKDIVINNKYNFRMFYKEVIPLITGPITQHYVDWAKNGVNFIGTMPRSGTNFLSYFFNYYHMLLDGVDIKENNLIVPIEYVKGAWAGVMEHTMSFKWFLISHNYCPGFESICSGAFRKSWNNLVEDMYENNDINYIFILEKFRNLLYPNLNNDVKIVFVYRNPLDQIISLERHFRNHINSPIENINFKDIEGKLMLINVYLKMYLSYLYMKKKFPKQIYFVTYEDLIQNKKKNLVEILKFFNFSLDNQHKLQMFNKVLNLVSHESLRNLELNSGKTLANDQKLSSKYESHMRGGKIGKWKGSFSDKELKIIESKFNEYGLSLNDFSGIDIKFS